MRHRREPVAKVPVEDLLHRHVIRPKRLRIPPRGSRRFRPQPRFHLPIEIDVVPRGEGQQRPDAPRHRGVDEGLGTPGDQTGAGHAGDDLADVVVAEHFEFAGGAVEGGDVPEGAGGAGVGGVAQLGAAGETEDGDVAKLVGGGEGVEVEEFLAGDAAGDGVVGQEDEAIEGGVVAEKVHAVADISDIGPVARGLHGLDHCGNAPELALEQELFLSHFVQA
mmetsp:Transcript_13266/g.29227  ORF Transcript_13266/g.29227 Transcript_13266/m.29227 type:complete len:221 (+) Transcript_13266:225-887(+)